MKTSLSFALALPFLLITLAPSAPALARDAGGANAGESAADDSAPTLLDRIVMIGASVTEGFGLSSELEAPGGAELFLDAALSVPHGAIESFSNPLFYNDPHGIGARQIEQAKALDPTLLLGLDFLFWYGYGQRGDGARPRVFEEGLRQLASLECPMVIADLPDMSPALKGSSPLMGGGPLIFPGQIPSPETLAQLNARLHEWAAEQPNVILLPLADFVQRVRKDEEMVVAGQTVPAGASAALLQSDLLHTTVEGTALLTLLVLDALQARREELGEVAFASTTDAIVAGVMERTAGPREKRRERERKREERRKAREEKKKREEEEDAGGGGLLVLERAH